MAGPQQELPFPPFAGRQTAKKDGPTVSRVLRDIVEGCAKEHPVLTTFGVLSTFVTPVQDVLLPHLIGQLVNAVRVAAESPPGGKPGFGEKGFNIRQMFTSSGHQSRAVRKAFTAVATAVGVLQVAYLGAEYVDARLYPAIMTFVRRRMLACVLDANDTAQSGELSTGELITQFVKVPWTVTNWFESTKSTMPHILVFFAATAYFWWIDTALGVCLLLSLVATAGALVQSLSSCRGVSEKRDIALNDVQEHIDELLRNLPAVYAGGQKQQEQDAMRPLEDTFESLYIRTMMCSSAVKLWLVPVAIALVAAVIWRCLRMLTVGKMSVGLFVTVLAVVMYIMASMMRVVQYARGVVYYWGILKASADILSCPSSSVLRTTTTSVPRSDMPVIAFRGVTYMHPKGAPGAPAVKDVTLDVHAGDRIALVGEIGSGKTTMLRLMLRLVEPTRGELLLNGETYTSLGADRVRKTFGYVPQSASLFDRTVLENVVYGVSPHPGEAEAWAAAKRLGLDTVLAALPAGMSTRCGKGGSGLSGGQRQAVWLTRMALRNPEVLVLDEPTSAMDPANRAQVGAAVAKGFKTVVFVTHDADLVEAVATRVVVMEKGEVVGG